MIYANPPEEAPINRFVSAIVAVAISVVTLIGPAFPLPVLQRIKASGVLKFPLMVAKGPDYITDPRTGYWSGDFLDWTKNIAGLLGVKIEYYETPWSNFAADFQADRINLAVGLPNPCLGLVVDYFLGATVEDWGRLQPVPARNRSPGAATRVNSCCRTVIRGFAAFVGRFLEQTRLLGPLDASAFAHSTISSNKG